ncbi:hypothetical protein [Lysinibacillus sphaericus]|uniref:YppG-like protein n=1 Tax=Lysinibacillus sphaericus OT4b.31 TaxID=1285586 RepID=R7Z968_LYSSH|nr:hypothetical protein [Lysinibacillus sphaericus]EON70501.1 hypothetical protein H131_20692 [Lysinibacillus sphaericus OT4b.31]
MPFYPPNPGRRPLPPRYRQGSNRGRQEQPFFYPNQLPQASRFGRLPDSINAIMGHAGTITNGVNMLRQMGSLLSLFK